jgi:hypothetical protein
MRTRTLIAVSGLIILTGNPLVCRAQNKTLISDTLFEATGTLAVGTAQITWPAFTSPDNFPIAQGSTTITISNGSVSVQLVPTIGSTPAGTSYTVTYFLQNSVTYTEYWTVPQTGPVTLTQVRTTPVPTPTTTFGEHQLTLGNGLQTLLAFWRQSSAPVATAEGQCYWSTSAHAINCTDQTLTFNALGGSDPTRVSKAGDTMTGSLLAANGNVQLGLGKPFGGFYQSQSGAGSVLTTTSLNSSGFNLAVTDGNVNGDPNSAIFAHMSFQTDGTTTNPNFSNQTGLQIDFSSINGQNDQDQSAKKTFINILTANSHYGAGQRANIVTSSICYGMGDCFSTSEQLFMYAGLNASGDEGTAFRTMNLLQGQSLATSTVASNTPQTSCNTVTTQAVSKNIAPQQVTVTSTTGCNAGDWVVVGRGTVSVTSAVKIEAVHLTAVSPGVITGVFTKDHVNADTVTPATVLTLRSNYQMGQLRWLVNFSQPSYAQGTVGSVSGFNFIGNGTTWTSNMVGGDGPLPGCFSFAADDYTSYPFDSINVLRSWYPISGVNSPTSLGYYQVNAVGRKGYTGNGPGNGTYTIRPCARILNVIGSPLGPPNILVLETNTFQWNVGDSVEAVLSVDGVVAGEYMRVGWWMPGATLGPVYSATNEGARTFYAALAASAAMTTSADGYQYGVAIDAPTTTGMSINGPNSSGVAISLVSHSEADKKAISFVGGANGSQIYGDYNTGTLTLLAATYQSTPAQLSLTSTQSAILQGNLTVSGPTFDPKIRLQNTSGVNATSFEWRNVQSSAYFSGNPGMDLFVDLLNRPLLTMLVSSDPSGELGMNSKASATFSSNAPSYAMGYAFETFNGISSDRRYVHTRVVPDAGIVAAGGVYAPVEWQLSGTHVLPASAAVFAGIKSTGVFRFGSGFTHNMVSFDASGLAASQTLTVPNASGMLALGTAPGTSGTAPNWAATGGLNIPLASSGGVTAGLLGNTDYLSFSGKQNVLTFTTPLSENGTTVACPSCEVQSNKNVASGYAGLTSGGKLVTSQGQKIWAATDLTTYTSTSGQGTTALQSTIAAPAVGHVLTWSGTDWVNQALPAITLHNLLSSVHSDTTPGTVIRGDLITGQGSTAAWARLALGGSGRYLRSNGTDLAYSSVAASGAGACGSNQWITAANDNAAPTCVQPAFSNLSGAASTAQLPATLVYNNQANVYTTGLQDFGSASQILPKSADPGAPSTGQIWINAGSLKYRDNAGTPATQTVEIQSNRNAAGGYAGLTVSGVLGAAQFPALTGDVTSTAGSLTTTLANVATAGTNTKITFNAKGQVTSGAQAQFTDIGGTLGSAQFPALTGDVTTAAGSLTTTLASVVTAATNTKITYNAKGQVTAGSQAQFGDIGGTLVASQFPALTGDVTTTAGSLTTTLPNIVAAGTNTKVTYNAKGQVTAGAQAQFIDIGGTLGASQFPALTGDITTTAGSLTATLPNIVTAATNTKVTYNAKGQVTAGAQAAASDLSNGTSGSGSVVLAGSPTVTDLTVNQNANGDDVIVGKRKTDSAPTGNLQHFQNAAGNADLWRVDVTGTLQSGTIPGSQVSGNIAGNAATATTLAATPNQCSSGQFATGIAAGGNANCSQPAAANLSNGITGGGVVVLGTSPTITTPTISGALGGNLDLSGNALVLEVANDTNTGTGSNQLAKLAGATSAAIKAATSDTSGVIGIVTGGAGVSGNAQIAREGKALCAFDGGTIAGDYVQISSSVAGDCHDAGSAYPVSGQVIGQVMTTNGSSGVFPVQVFSAGIVARAGATGPTGATGTTGPTGATGATPTCATGAVASTCVQRDTSAGVDASTFTVPDSGGTAQTMVSLAGVTLAPVFGPAVDPGSAPAIALAGSGAGSVTNGLHNVIVAYQLGSDFNTQTYTSAFIAINGATVVDNTVNGKLAVTGIPASGDARVTSKLLYMTKATSPTDFFLVATIANSATSYTINVADSGLATPLLNPFGSIGINTTACMNVSAAVAASLGQPPQTECYDEYGSIVFSPYSQPFFPGGFFLTNSAGGRRNIVADATATDGVSLFTPGQGRSGVLALSLLGTTSSIGGSSLSASCVTGTAAVAGAITGQPVTISRSDGTLLGAAFSERAAVSSNGTVTVQICGTGTPPAVTYNVVVHQ